MKQTRISICFLLLLTLPFSSLADSLHSFSTGIRYWHANWELKSQHDRLDLGAAPFWMAYFALHQSDFSIIGQLGYGDSWDADVSRLDLSFALTRSYEPLTFGIGFRRMYYDVEHTSAEWSYMGPEGLIGASFPLGEGNIWLSFTGSLGLYFWDFKHSFYSDDGITMGGTADAGVVVPLNNFVFRGGYRLQIVAEDDNMAGDEFKGIYLDAGFNF